MWGLFNTIGNMGAGHIILLVIGIVVVIGSVIAILDSFEGFIPFGIGILVIIAAIIPLYDDQREHAIPHFSHSAEGCSDERVRPLPAKATVLVVPDDRLGNIYACNYLRDYGIKPGLSLPLQGGLHEGTFADQVTESSTEWGGWLILGSGTMSGSSSSSQRTEYQNVFAFIAATDRGATKFVLPTEKVQLRSCTDGCQPAVRITVPDSPLFTKLNDESRDASIWTSYGNGAREHIVSQVSNKTEEDIHSKYGPRTTGGPKSVSEVVSALSTNVEIILPPSLVRAPTPVPVS